MNQILAKHSGMSEEEIEAVTSLLSAEIAYTLMTKENATFADVLELHEGISFKENCGVIETSLVRKFAYLEEQDSSCFTVSCWRSFNQFPIKTASCVFSALNTTIDTIFSPELRTMIANKKKVDFEKLGNKRTVLFVSTSAVNPALNCFINMFYAQAFV